MAKISEAAMARRLARQVAREGKREQAEEPIDPHMDMSAPSEKMLVDIQEPEAQPSAPAPEPPRPTLQVSAREVTDEDIDLLWDWIRKDEDRGSAFLGKPMDTYSQMLSAANVFSVMHAILLNGVCAGFFALHPVTPAQAFGHLYLAPQVRGHVGQILPGLLEWFDTRMAPRQLVLALKDPRLARLYAPFGFDVGFILTRQARAAV